MTFNEWLNCEQKSYKKNLGKVKNAQVLSGDGLNKPVLPFKQDQVQ